jgi:hypothetical protein
MSSDNGSRPWEKCSVRTENVAAWKDAQQYGDLGGRNLCGDQWTGAVVIHNASLAPFWLVPGCGTAVVSSLS